ncbi:S-layer homology domain-containing protein [Candidatus Vampirococcus lugosii]|uniref:SLH domain-containing protein n=1 Tax=Candidatus Vampirococcus lugosii TaxID=2789015 RepID=A0ABS5QLG8_9BACT|nr:S-layer homology domain-containing protein [Candidatus Vampirococcus lugosii]MBS8122045.1 hypothetical protein [Candidatus Vampirococcus lugosii]
MWEGWSGNDKTIETVRNSTLNPISFVEKNLGTVGDDLQRQDINVNTNNINEKNNENIKKENKNENEDLLQQITKQLEQEYSNNIQQNNNNKNIKEVLEIIEISNPKIDNKLTLGDNIKFTVKTKGEDGNITISSNNDVLKPSQYTITPKKEKNEYEVLVSAQNIGNGRVVFSDGKSNKDYYFSVYQDVQEIFSLGINGPDTIFNTVKQKFTIYPIDKLGNTVNYNLDGNINISLLDRETNKSYDLMNQKINKQNNLFKFEIQAPKISNYRLIVNFKDEKNNLSANKNLESDIFIDYSKNDKYGNSMKELNKKGIIKGFEGKMMPNNNIIRAEIITTLVRYKYGDDFERFKNEMNKYIEKNGIFFEDINPEARYSPYIFMAYQDGVVKGAGGTHANPTIQAQKDELIALYSRFFNISKKDQFPSFIDVNQDDWFVDYANAAKNYNLFPFENKNKFEGSDFVSREKAFESLYRYMNVGEKMQPKIKTTEQKLEDAVKALINF